MQRLGKVLNVTPSQNIVVRIEKPPRINSAAVDENLRIVGRIFDIIGPVSSPYALIKPSIKNPEKLANKQLYVSPSKN